MKLDTQLVPQLTARGFRPVARLRPRAAREIAAAGPTPWSVGCETVDRDYVAFGPVRPHLAELGATAVRLQAGWAKCEPKGDGRYDWAWLDEIVDGCVEMGVRPWLQASYGNPRYEGGGGIGLAQGGPTSPAALAAWYKWVSAMAARYADRVGAWEVWNEPDLHDAFTPRAYATFFARTAASLKAASPKVPVLGIALCYKADFATEVLDALAEDGNTHLLDHVTYHTYPHNPDDNFDVADAIIAHLKKLAPHATLRQGETGAPSETRKFMALGDHEWNEHKQAAWDLRRLLAHHARGIPMSLFQIADMQYTRAGGAKFDGRNAKGLLFTREDKSVAYRKPAYFMAQHVFTTFDSAFPLRKLENLAADREVRTAAYAWTRAGEKAPSLVGWWRCDGPPALAAELGAEAIALPPHAIDDPVLVDFMSGVVFELPESGDVWSSLPCADVPLALAARSALHLRSLEGVPA